MKTVEEIKQKMGKIVITKPMVGICGMQVCVDKKATDEEILQKCNNENTAGTTNGWATVVRKKGHSFFVDSKGKPNDLPVTCSDDKDREHLIVLC